MMMWTSLCFACALSVAACTDGSQDTGGGELPPGDDGVDDNPDTGSGYIGPDTGPTGDTGYNEVPANTLSMTHEGSWTMVPLGGPYTSLTGSLAVTEVMDTGEVICQVLYSLTGDAVDEACPHCTEAFAINFYVTAEGWFEEDEDGNDVQRGGVDDCEYPDLPADGDVWRMGYADVDKAVFFDYFDSGIWVSWYDAEQVHDDVSFSLDAVVGYVPVDEDD